MLSTAGCQFQLIGVHFLKIRFSHSNGIDHLIHCIYFERAKQCTLLEWEIPFIIIHHLKDDYFLMIATQECERLA